MEWLFLELGNLFLFYFRGKKKNKMSEIMGNCLGLLVEFGGRVYLIILVVNK